MNIAMTCYNRYSYLLRSIKSLFNSNFDEPTKLYLFDDNSEDPKVKKLLESLGSKDNLEVNLIFNKKNIGCDPNMLLKIQKKTLSSQPIATRYTIQSGTIT